MKTGKVIQIIGAAVDIQFAQDHLPAIENAIEIEMDWKAKNFNPMSFTENDVYELN